MPTFKLDSSMSLDDEAYLIHPDRIASKPQVLNGNSPYGIWGAIGSYNGKASKPKLNDTSRSSVWRGLPCAATL